MTMTPGATGTGGGTTTSRVRPAEAASPIAGPGVSAGETEAEVVWRRRVGQRGPGFSSMSPQLRRASPRPVRWWRTWHVEMWVARRARPDGPTVVTEPHTQVADTHQDWRCRGTPHGPWSGGKSSTREKNGRMAQAVRKRRVRSMRPMAEGPGGSTGPGLGSTPVERREDPRPVLGGTWLGAARGGGEWRKEEVSKGGASKLERGGGGGRKA